MGPIHSQGGLRTDMHSVPLEMGGRQSLLQLRKSCFLLSSICDAGRETQNDRRTLCCMATPPAPRELKSLSITR